MNTNSNIPTDNAGNVSNKKNTSNACERTYRNFISQLSAWSKNGVIPTAVDQYMAYHLQLQKERLTRHQFRLEYDFKARGQYSENIRQQDYSDTKYTNSMLYNSYTKETTIFHQNRRVFRTKANENIYGIVTSLNADRMTGKEAYTCPNCGNISSVRALMQGCPYCHTHFQMTDLFPKVTNFYALRDYYLTLPDLGKKVLKAILLGFIIGPVIGIVGGIIGYYNYTYLGISPDELEEFIVALFILMITISWHVTLFFVPLSLAFEVFKDAFKILPLLFSSGDTKTRIKRTISMHDPLFSYDYFESRMVSLVKLMVFSEDRSNLSVCQNPQACGVYPDILDTAYRGLLACRSIEIKDSYCHLEVEVFVQNTCIVRNKIKQKNQSFILKLVKNVKKPTSLGFSIKEVECPNCGASFDATHEKHCPYCSTPYNLAEDDWVVLSFRRK